MTSLGVMFRRDFAPELLADFARNAERGGFDELWVVEDLGFHGGFSQVAVALCATSRLTVGLGIAPAVARNAAYLAMETATIARIFPERFHLGLGHGVETWIAQVGATPTSWLRSIEEVTVATKLLMAGQAVSMHGQHVRLDDVTLVHPVPDPLPLVSFGVRQPKSIALAGQVADGVILAECSGPRYVRETRQAIGPDARLTVFINATADIDAARAEIDTRLAQPRFTTQLGAYADSDADLYQELIISGDPASWLEQTNRWIAAGADAIVWVPLTTDPAGVLATFVDALATGTP